MNHLQAVNTLAIERYLLDEMPREERDSFEEHFFSCVECAEDARVAATMRDGAAAGLARTNASSAVDRGAVLPFRPPSRGWRGSVALPWAAAATLAVGLGYQTIQGPLMTGQVADSVALTPSTLRPASRGQEAVVTAGPNGAVTLAVDLGGAQFGPSIKYEFAIADGKKIASGEAPAPAAGAPLLLMLSGSALKGSDRYVLTLHGESGVLTPAPYRFRVKAP
jgi:anti-sigma factor RsiW